MGEIIHVSIKQNHISSKYITYFVHHPTEAPVRSKLFWQLQKLSKDGHGLAFETCISFGYYFNQPIEVHVSKALIITNSDGRLWKVFVAIKIISSVRALLSGYELSKWYISMRYDFVYLRRVWFCPLLLWQSSFSDMTCVYRNVSHCFRVTENIEIDAYCGKMGWVRGFFYTCLESLTSLLYVLGWFTWCLCLCWK